MGRVGVGISETEAAALVTFENLDANGDVGTGAAQVAAGDHTHTLVVTQELTGSKRTTTATEWYTTREVTVSGLKKIVAWVQGWGINPGNTRATGWCRITVDDVEKIVATQSSPSAVASAYSLAVQYAGAPGVVKHQIYSSSDETGAGGAAGVFSIGV